MDDLKKFFDGLTNLWTVLLGLAGGIGAAWKFYRTYGIRIIRAMRLSDAIHSKFGPRAADVFLRDFDDRKRESLIRESRQKLVEKELDLAVFISGADGGCQWASEECADLFGISDTACVGFGWLVGINPDEQHIVYETWMSSIRNKLPYERSFKVHNQRTGEYIPCTLKAYPLTGSDRTVYGYTALILRDKDHA